MMSMHRPVMVSRFMSSQAKPIITFEAVLEKFACTHTAFCRLVDTGKGKIGNHILN